MATAAIAGQLARVLEAEAIVAEAAALATIARAARGSMRDALSLLDQAIAYGGGSVTLAAVRSMLGAIDGELLVTLLQHLAARDFAAMLALADEMARQNLSFGQALRDLAALLHRIALAQQVPAQVPADGAMEPGDSEAEEGEALRALARRLAPDEVQLYYQVALHGRNDLHLAPDEYAGFTMTLLRMLAFQPEAAPAPGAARPAPLQGAGPLRASTPVPVRPPRAAAPPPVLSPVQAAVPPVPPPAPAAAPVHRFDGDWTGLVARLGLGGLAGQLAARSELIGFDDDHFRLRVPIKSLLDAGAADKLQTALRQVFGPAIRVSAEIGSPQTATAAERAREAHNEQRRRAADAIYADPFVRELVESFGAEVEPESIRAAAPATEQDGSTAPGPAVPRISP
jgi:DNA polymerase-3 subunit gamma/tau